MSQAVAIEGHGNRGLQAICFVASLLPDKRRSLREVKQASVVFAGELGAEVEELVGRFIDSHPRCYGICRRQEYWDILLTHFCQEQSLRLYLRGFPKYLTTRQREAMRKYLVTEMRFDEQIVVEYLRTFRHRENQKIFGKEYF